MLRRGTQGAVQGPKRGTHRHKHQQRESRGGRARAEAAIYQEEARPEGVAPGQEGERQQAQRASAVQPLKALWPPSLRACTRHMAAGGPHWRVQPRAPPGMSPGRLACQHARKLW